MSSVTIRQNHSKSNEEVRRIVQDVEDNLVSHVNLDTRWQGDKVIFRRSGLEGELRMEPGCVVVNMKLGIMLGLFSRQIQTELEKNLSEKLA